MKIEKVNDSQIRCTLSKADLDNREIKLSELVYGSEKTKNLFRDMMEQASEELGFNANDIPLMIEAIPLETGSILLIITKVNEPEELDTRFSNFSSSVNKSDRKESSYTDGILDNPDVTDLFKKIKELSSEANYASEDTDSANEPSSVLPVEDEPNEQESKREKISCAYSFHSLNSVITVAHALNHSYDGNTSLYKDSSENLYYLVIHTKSDATEEFKKLCAVLSEYGELKPSVYGCTARIEEHCDLLIKDQALHKLI